MRIVGAQLGEAVRYPDSHGDNWYSTWADDGALYSVSDDTRGFDRACSSNLAIHRITGEAPPELHGETINPMPEYGGWGEFLPQDDAMWKGNGLACIDGVLYLSVSRHANPDGRFSVQEAWDASIIKSYDHGRTWSAAPGLGAAMFPGHTFATPFFVDYGQDGQATADGADRFVYAISSNGVWNNGSSMALGRVPRDRIARLDAADWEFVHGFDDAGQPRWWPRHDTARYVFRAPGRASMTGVHYLTPLGLYILPQWHYTLLDDPERRWSATRMELYQSRAPWGPWSLFHTQPFEPSGWYNPSIPAKFIAPDGRRFWIFVAGDWTTCRSFDSFYGLFMIPVTLDVEETASFSPGAA